MFVVKSLVLFVAAITGTSALRGHDDEHLQWKVITKQESQDKVERGLQILPPGSATKASEAHRKLSKQWVLLGTNDESNFSLLGSSGRVIRFNTNYANSDYGAVCNKKGCAGDISAVAVGYKCGTKKRSCIDLVFNDNTDWYIMCPLTGYRMSSLVEYCHCAAGGLCNGSLEHSPGDYYYSFSSADSCSGTEDRPLFYFTLKCDPFP